MSLPPIEERINISPASLSSHDDENRKELLWENREEELLQKWMHEMYDMGKSHNVSGRHYKKLYGYFGVPATLIPIVLSGLNQQLEEYPLVQSLLMISTGALIGVSTFFNLGKRYAQHFEYENRYLELARGLEKELNKPKRHRLACDVYMEKIYLQYCALNARAPNTSQNK